MAHYVLNDKREVIPSDYTGWSEFQDANNGMCMILSTDVGEEKIHTLFVGFSANLLRLQVAQTFQTTSSFFSIAEKTGTWQEAVSVHERAVRQLEQFYKILRTKEITYEVKCPLKTTINESAPGSNNDKGAI